MRKLFVSLMILSAVFGLQSCGDEKKEEVKVSANKTFDVNLQMPLAIVCSDGMLIASDLFDNTGMVKLFDTKTGKEVAQVAPKGGSKSEVLEVSDFEVQTVGDRTFLALYDLEKGRVMEYDLAVIRRDGKQVPTVSEIKSDNRYCGLRKLSKGYAALGLFEDYKFELLDDSLKTVSSYGDYLSNENGTTDKMVNDTANFGRSEVSPNKALLVNIAYAAGVVRFYDVEGNKLAHKKDFVVAPLKYEIDGSSYKNLGNMGFLSVAISNKYVYALYSGEKENLDVPIPLGSHVYQFDYSGNLQTIYGLDAPTHAIAVDKENDTLYTLVDKEGYKVYCYQMN